MKLVFERKDGLACVEFLYKAVAQYYSRGYELAFIDSWSFAYDISSGFATSNEGNREANLQKYHGIKVCSLVAEGQNNILHKVKLMLAEKGMCMMRTDLYYIPWSASCYKKRHWNHAVLITDIFQDGYFCYDFFSTDGAVLPFDHIPNRVSLSVFEFVAPENEVRNINDCKALLTRAITKGIADSRAFAQMERFAKSLNDSFNIQAMTSDSEVLENSRFISAINRIAQCRFQFAIVIEYLNVLFPEISFSDIESMLRKSAVYWKSITALLVKSYFLEDSSQIIRKVSSKVLDVKALEEQIYIELKKALESNSLQIMERLHEPVQPHLLSKERWKFVDIQRYTNHKAFGDMANTQHARYEQIYFILLSQEIEAPILSFDSFCFRLIDLKVNKYDNIECAKQVIEINAECSELALLANAEYDHQIDYMEVWGTNLKQHIEISTTSWKCTPVLGDTIVWSGKSAVQNEQTIKVAPKDGHLFGKIYKISKTYVEKIVLPNNPNFHIFALSYR